MYLEKNNENNKKSAGAQEGKIEFVAINHDTSRIPTP